VSIMAISNALAADNDRIAAFWIRETSEGAYQIMIESNSIVPMLPVGSPFAAADKAKAWIENESASWFVKFRQGVCDC